MVTLLLRFSILPDKLREFEQTVDWLQQPGGQKEGAEGGLLYRRWGSEKAEFMYVEVLAEGEGQACLLRATIDTRKCDEARKQIPVLNDRRPDVYEL